MKREQFVKAQTINKKIVRLEELKLKLESSKFGLIKEVQPSDVLELNEFVDQSFEEMQDEYALISQLHDAINNTIKNELYEWINIRIRALESEFESI